MMDRCVRGECWFRVLGVSGAQHGGGKLNYGAEQNPRSALLGDLFLMGNCRLWTVTDEMRASRRS